MTKNCDAVAVGKVVAAALFGLVFCAGPVAAAPAGAAPAPAAKSAPPPMQTAPAQPATPDDPAKVAAAREFILLYHPQMDPKAAATKLDQLMPRMIEAAKKENPKQDANKIVADRKARILDRITRSLEVQSQVVSRHFTLPELKELAAFYSSPLGRKLVAENPKIQREIMLLGPLRRGQLAGPGGSKATVNPPPGASATPAKGSSPPKK